MNSTSLNLQNVIYELLFKKIVFNVLRILSYDNKLEAMQDGFIFTATELCLWQSFRYRNKFNKCLLSKCFMIFSFPTQLGWTEYLVNESTGSKHYRVATKPYVGVYALLFFFLIINGFFASNRKV